MFLQVAITLFSPAHPNAHFMFLLSSQTWSLDVSLEKCHTLPIIIHYMVFIISHVSTVLWYHSVPKLSFSPPHTQSPLVFHFVFLSMGFSHTPYMSLHMTHTTKITLSFLFHRHTHSLHSSFTLSFSLWDSLTHPICLYIWLIPLKLLSLSPVDTTFVAVSFSSPSQTDIIHLFTDQTTPPLSNRHTHNSCFHSPSRLPSLSHTHTKLSVSHPDSYFSHMHLLTS